MKTIIKRGKKYIKTIWAIFVGVAIFLTYLAVYKDRYQELFSSNLKAEMNILQNIWVSQTIDYYEGLLWEPKFLNKESFTWYSEYIFEKKSFYIQAVVDNKNVVQFYSIAAKKPITINVLWADITLCKTKFSEIDTEYWYRWKGWYISNRNLEYFEVYWGDGVHDYKEYVFAYNQLSPCGNFDYQWGPESKVLDMTYWTWMSDKGNEIIGKEYRKKSIVNTYGEASSEYSLEWHNKNLDFWPFYGQVMFGMSPPKFWWSFNNDN